MTIKEYLNALNKRYKSGISHEHSYRGDLQNLFENLTTGVTITNEPTRVECRAPDYIITTNNDIPVGFIEAKDTGKPLNSKEFNCHDVAIVDIVFEGVFGAQVIKTVGFGMVVTKRLPGVPGNDFVPILNKFKTYIPAEFYDVPFSWGRKYCRSFIREASVCLYLSLFEYLHLMGQAP